MEVAPLLPPIPLPSAFQIPGTNLGACHWSIHHDGHQIPPRIRDIPGPGVPQTEPKPEPTEEPVSKPPPVQPAPQIPPTITPELPPLPVTTT